MNGKVYVTLGGEHGAGIFGRNELRSIIGEDATKALPRVPDDVIADQFFLLETAQNEELVFSLRDGGLLYRGKKTPKLKPVDTPFPWDGEMPSENE